MGAKMHHEPISPSTISQKASSNIAIQIKIKYKATLNKKSKRKGQAKDVGKVFNEKHKKMDHQIT